MQLHQLKSQHPANQQATAFEESLNAQLKHAEQDWTVGTQGQTDVEAQLKLLQSARQPVQQLKADKLQALQVQSQQIAHHHQMQQIQAQLVGQLYKHQNLPSANALPGAAAAGICIA